MKFKSLITIIVAALALAWLVPRAATQPAGQPAGQQAGNDRGQGVKPPAERRVALVLGNGAYADNSLENPANDARGVAAALRELGFEVITDVDKDLTGMRRLIRTFGERLRGSSVALFFFAGHGVQVNGVNYLIPIGHQIEREADVRLEAVSADDVLAQMEEAGTGVNLMILDACRDNPFRSLRRSQGQRGLALVTAPSGTLIAYATAPGNTAADGKGRPNSPYTTNLLQHIRTPGLKIEDFFKRVRRGVEDLTQRKQTPWEASSLRGDFYFAAPLPEPPVNPLPVYSGEQAYWRAIEDSSDAQDFRDYLKQHPTGVYASAARVKLRRLEAVANTNSAPVTNPNPTATPPPKPTPTPAPALADAKVGGPSVRLVAMPFTTAEVDAGGMVRKFAGQPAQGFVEELGNGVKLEMVELLGGTFDMGSPSTEANHNSDEVVRRGVRINALYVGRYEVTQAQWKAVMSSLPKVGFSGDDLPVESVSWEEAVKFCKKLSAKTGREYRLPTEAEWEYTARAGAQTPFAFGATITPEIVNYNGNYPYGNAPKGSYREKTVPVGSMGVANAWGLFDMHGNVWEWCQDWYGTYDAKQFDNPKGPSSGQSRVLRGGSWNYNADNCRSASRSNNRPAIDLSDFGFRVVVSARTQ
ncbi:MAG: SUMF1/EgtB/PvdO family nonheme iron enzyme [Acidobacteria bacterium]|nr:SUMF1/EgtB/PvdO family nonheme iron enzyme [Acidobacteriota bacterium]MBI3423801.1 SUMF1/EgtB/PvdO family nonheme iron enzyme [Acidobacteriota bacterium]